ncbi:hypothetical protein [Staphylococcus equorum]|uniref:Uncharacterized protein n=1 Tax=Staphylococcus equorum TaxID=246432 RepID=A0AAP7IEZ1_9STAP|nr:hypothetical protein [Staphylococcus equorum]OEK58857.1 hypothetical protein ASS94_00620 [Staphylococcus equorum]
MNEDSLVLVIFNRFPTENEVAEGIAEDDRMIDSTIVHGNERYEAFIESEEAHELEFDVTAIHYITDEGYIMGIV